MLINKLWEIQWLVCPLDAKLRALLSNLSFQGLGVGCGDARSSDGIQARVAVGSRQNATFYQSLSLEPRGLV
ncbi:hypothetical protein LINGRAHAP2_LOCUS2697 [Linum grandiflorum]